MKREQDDVFRRRRIKRAIWEARLERASILITIMAFVMLGIFLLGAAIHLMTEPSIPM